MKWMKKILSLLVFLSCQFAFAQGNDYQSIGQNLEQALYKTVVNQDWQALEKMTAPEFQSIHADKIRNRNEALAYIKSLRFNHYNFSNLRVTQNQPGNTLVITYDVTYAETVNGHPQSGKLTKNISVWDNVGGQWQWVAHAVLD